MMAQNELEAPLRDPWGSSSAAPAELWVIESTRGLVVRCENVELGREDVRFEVGAVLLDRGAHCELCSNRPGSSTPPGMGYAFSHGATITAVDSRRIGGRRVFRIEAHLEVCVPRRRQDR